MDSNNKKTLILILVGLVCIILISLKANALDLKFYTFEMQKNNISCIEMMQEIPMQYWGGVKRVEFRGYRYRIKGMMYISGKMILYDDCQVETMIHELAHWQQWIHGDTLYQLINHSGNYSYYYDLITNERRN